MYSPSIQLVVTDHKEIISTRCMTYIDSEEVKTEKRNSETSDTAPLNGYDDDDHRMDNEKKIYSIMTVYTMHTRKIVRAYDQLKVNKD